ncbi:MAG: Hpt domain-containing protein [Pseudomonadota bacterium]
MGQAHPVFDAPECHDLSKYRAAPVDLEHLSSQTGGDKLLEEEVLQLFVRQAHMLTRDIRSSRNAEARKQLAHALNGAARAIGAHGVAHLAKIVEDEPSQKGNVSPLIDQVCETCDYISSLTR